MLTDAALRTTAGQSGAECAASRETFKKELSHTKKDDMQFVDLEDWRMGYFLVSIKFEVHYIFQLGVEALNDTNSSSC